MPIISTDVKIIGKHLKKYEDTYLKSKYIIYYERLDKEIIIQKILKNKNKIVEDVGLYGIERNMYFYKKICKVEKINPQLWTS